MVTCARLAPACIDISPMAPPINSEFITALTTSIVTRPSTTVTNSITTLKPKLAFTIDALVGEKTAETPLITEQCALRISTPIPLVRGPESTTTNYRSQSPHNEPLCDVVGNSPTPSSECCQSCSSIEVQDTSRDKPTILSNLNQQKLPTGPIRPLPMQLMTNTLPQNVTPNLSHSIASASTTTTISTGTVPPLPPTHPVQPNFLTAQFQMAAALAHQHHQQQQHLSTMHLPPGHPMTLFPHMSSNPHPHMLAAPPFIRESYPLYPWFLSRHGRIFPHRFPGNFLLQPFRKPKRVRTAFSPTQLLKLEHAFEGNHYVVGAERKQLAQGLSLTETQVKVWFQNRRTKHKRMQQEGGESDTKSNKDSQSDDIDAKNNDNRSENSFEDYDNVMTVDDDDEDDIEEEGADEQHAHDFDGQDELIDMNEYGSDLDADEQKKMHQQFQEQIKQHQQILLQQQYIHKDNHQQQHHQQQQINLQHLSQQQFMNHQLHLQQQKPPQQQQPSST